MTQNMQSNINTLLDPVVNFGKVTVSTGYTNADTTPIILNTGEGTKLPDPTTSGSFNLVWYNSTDYPDPADDPNVEIIRCIARSGNAISITRAQEGTVASNKNISGKIYKMVLSPTKKTIDDIGTDSISKVSAHSALSTGVHGVGADTVDGVSARNSAIYSHSSITTAHGSTSVATVSTIVQRDAAGRAKVAAPSASDDIAIKSTVDTVSTNLDTHSGLATAHGSSGAILGVTTANATYAPIAKGVTNGDSHDHNGGDGAQINHTTLSNIGTNTHSNIDTAISSSTSHIAASAPHSGHDTPTQRDAAITNHAGLITGVHGVTGSYILGTEDMGVVNGVASLDANGKIPTSQLPGLALTNVYTVASQAAQITLLATTQEGDVAIRSDENKSYVRNAGTAGTMADWTLLLTPTDVVTSVFGRTGVVAASNNDYTWAQINKATSSIADITTRSHTALTDIGTYNHATIDAHMESATAHGSTSAATVSAIVQRDAAGRAKVAAPSATDDIAIKSTVDTVSTNLDTHTNNTATAHGVTGTTVGTTNTQTLTNKRITARVQSVTDAATVTPSADNDDAVEITAIAQAFTIANHSGTPTNFQKLIIRIKDNGTARAITWGSNYAAGGVALPTTTVLSKILTLGFIYNTANALNKWQLVASAQEA